MSGNLMDLVKELKALNARKKAGEALSAAEEQRRRELKVYLRSTLEAQGAGASSIEESAIKEAPAASTRSSAAPVAPARDIPLAKPIAPASPPPASAAAPPTKPAVPRPVSTPGTASAMSFLDESLPPQRAPTIPPASGARPTAPLPGSMGSLDEDLPPPSKQPGRPNPIDSLDEDVPPPSMRTNPPASGGRPSPAMMGSLDEDVPPPSKQPGRPNPIGSLDEDVPPPQTGAPKPFVPKKDFFAINAGSLVDDAAKSDAVAKVDPWANRKAKASKAEVEEAEARAEAALRANKKKDRAKTPEEAIEQLKETEAAYTAPEESFVLEQYYGAFEMEGYERVDVRTVDLKPIDPREMELAKLDVAGGPAGGATTVTVPPGLAFLDDFPVLYAKRIVPPADDEVVIDSNDPNMLIPGKRKVTVHLLNGERKQGAIRALRRGELGFKLEPVGNGLPEEVSIAQVKAVFIHLQPNQSVREIPGRALTATFRDGRSVQGTSDDYQPGSPVFTLVPPAGRGQFERIIVNAAALSSVA